MKRVPQNVRVRNPQPPKLREEIKRPAAAPRFIQTLTPTPPPVTRMVTRESEPPNSLRAVTDKAPKKTEREYSPSRLWVGMVIGLIVAAALVVARGPAKQVNAVLGQFGLDTSRLTLPVASSEVAPSASAVPVVEEPASIIRPRADEKVRRQGYSPVSGGVVFTPPTLKSADGSYDLLLHFHGNVKVVVESAVVAKLNAVVAVINLGIGSGVYQDTYASNGTYEDLLQQIQAAVTARGLKHARLRRVALSSWSAGYGAISSILEVRRGTDPLDAVLILDGIHSGWLPERPNVVNPLQIEPFLAAAHAAALGKLLFTATYSQITPEDYAGSRESARFLLNEVRNDAPLFTEVGKTPPYLKLESMKGAVSKEDERTLIPVEEARVGNFHVRGYKGNRKGDHMAHLFQMGATLVPELAARWMWSGDDSSKFDTIRLGRRRAGSR